MQALFEGAVLRLPCVNRDWAGLAVGQPCPQRPVIDGRSEKGGLSRWARFCLSRRSKEQANCEAASGGMGRGACKAPLVPFVYKFRPATVPRRTNHDAAYSGLAVPSTLLLELLEGNWVVPGSICLYLRHNYLFRFMLWNRSARVSPCGQAQTRYHSSAQYDLQRPHELYLL
jgi:hypothetical protein